MSLMLLRVEGLGRLAPQQACSELRPNLGAYGVGFVLVTSLMPAFVMDVRRTWIFLGCCSDCSEGTDAQYFSPSTLGPQRQRRRAPCPSSAKQTRTYVYVHTRTRRPHRTFDSHTSMDVYLILSSVRAPKPALSPRVAHTTVCG